MFKVGDKVIYKGVPKDFKRIDNKAVILRKTFEPNYFVIKLNSGAEILVSTDKNNIGIVAVAVVISLFRLLRG